MRETKFRAYILGKMWEVRAIDWNENGVFIHTDGGFMHLCEEDNVHLLEYTGLKDKNGKEEYHKDILDGRGLGNLVIEYGFYDNDEAYEDNDSGFGWYLRSLNDGKVYGIAYINLYECPIIGNCYENKELLD